ncbi:MAG: hypothetical protein J6X44_08050 [Thermoguttaceae bacterium]|nr:hypothetical protein [Thermoguttaceae bacterium]
MQKHAIETRSWSPKHKRSGRSKNDNRNPSANRICRIEELEKREYLAADPISVGVVYAEQYVENLGDKFYVAWVGGEDGCTTLDTLVIDLDKNQNGNLDEGEACFDVEGSGEVYSYVPFTLIEKSDEIGYQAYVEDGGMVLTISFTNFHAGDAFVFCIDLDEYQPSSTNNAQVEGAEMGGSLVDNLEGSRVKATFSSTHYQTEVWTGMFVDHYDTEYQRSPELDEAYSSGAGLRPQDNRFLPLDNDDQNEGISQAGVYDNFDLKPKPIVVSGFVYEDHDVDCDYDRGEDVPIAGVEVTLLNETGAVVGVAATDVHWFYQFKGDNLLPGCYRIVSQSDVLSPTGSYYADFCAHGGTFGEKISPLVIEVKGMEGGDVAPDNNFAKVLPGSISGFVFEDRNNADGKNEGESWDGIRYPAQIELYRIDYTESGSVYTLMETQTVDKDGYYEFILDCSYNAAGTSRKLPGRTYEVREIFNSSDYVDGKDYVGSLGGVVMNDVISEIFVGYDEHGVHYDFGELKLGSIAGNVYEDRNDNGIIDPGEAGIANVTVELYQFDGARYVYLRSVETDANGSYRFDGLDIIKNYAVKEIQPTDYADGKDSIGSLQGLKANDYFYDVEVGWDQHGVDYNFGELKLGSIEGNVFEDRNDNGVFDSAEKGIASVRIGLYQWNGSGYEFLRETSTDLDGAYRFDDLDIARQYAVRELEQPAGYVDGKDHIGSLGGEILNNEEIRSIDVQWDDHGVNYDFGELKLGSISGFVYHDANDNGNFEINEDPISDVTVKLYRLNGEKYEYVAETRTDSRGFYKFDSLDINQTYAVKEIQPVDWNDGKDSIGTLGGNIDESDFIDSVRVLWDQHGEQYNFGELLPVGSLSGFVYEDNNDNGVKEEGEIGIKDVLVQLYVVGDDGLATLVGSRQTDENGYYEFDNLKPKLTYIVRETQPTAYYDGKETIGTIFGEVVGKQINNDEIVDILMPNNGKGIHYDFGELKPASISGYVYEDLNDNGIKESNEPGIPNTAVTLWILNESTSEYEETGREVHTDSAGHYIFDNLQPGRIYRLVETQPAGYNDGKDTVGSLGGEKGNDVFFNINVKPGDKGIDYNFGELKPQPKHDVPDVGVPPRTVNVPNNLWGVAPSSFPYIFNQPYIPGSMTTLYGGGGGFVDNCTWHLSTINDAYPRSSAEPLFGFRVDNKYIEDSQRLLASYGIESSTVEASNGDVRYLTAAVSGTGSINLKEYKRGKWLLARSLDNVSDLVEYTFGERGAKAVVGDWSADGKDYVGLFVDGAWLLDRNGDGKWDSSDIFASIRTEQINNQPITGDWDGDGKTDIGVFGPRWINDQKYLDAEKGLPSDDSALATSVTNAKIAENVPIEENELFATEKNSRLITRVSEGRIRSDLIDHVFEYGRDGDVAITGDWNGDGIAEIGVYRNGKWLLDVNGNGEWDSGDKIFALDADDDPRSITPIVGDWDGDGRDEIGVYRETGDSESVEESENIITYDNYGSSNQQYPY